MNGDAEHRRLQKQIDHMRRTNPEYQGKDGPGVPWPEAWSIPDEPESTLSRDALSLQRYLEGRVEPLSDEELEHWVKAAPMVLALKRERYQRELAAYQKRSHESWLARRKDQHWWPPGGRPYLKHWQPLAWCVYRIVEGYRPDGARADAESPCHCPYCLSVPERKQCYDDWIAEFKAKPASERKAAHYWPLPVPDDAV